MSGGHVAGQQCKSLGSVLGLETELDLRDPQMYLE